MDEVKHECPQSKGMTVAFDAFFSNPISIEKGDGKWILSGGDVAMNIVYCPYCGQKL